MSIRSMTVQYVGNVLYVPKTERDVNIIVIRDYEGEDARFERVLECAPEFDGKWFRCKLCGERLDRFGVRTTYRGGETVREMADHPSRCPGCGCRFEEAD